MEAGMDAEISTAKIREKTNALARKDAERL